MSEEADREASAYAQSVLGVATHSPPRLTLVPTRYAAMVAECSPPIAEETAPAADPIETVAPANTIQASPGPGSGSRVRRSNHLRLTFGLCFVTAGALLGLRRRQRRGSSRS